MQTRSKSIGALRQDPTFALSYRLREPAPAHPTACVILLHGVGGNETNLAELAAELDPELLVVLPRGPLQLGPGQYGWFPVSFTANGPRIDPAAAEASRLALIRFITELETAYSVEPGRTLIGGFSQGGIMSASVALSAPERVSGFAILSGRILPEIAAQLASRERLAPLRAFISHGEFDGTLPVSWASRSEQWLTELGVSFETHRYPAEHQLTTAMRADFLRWADSLIANMPDAIADLRARYAALRADLPEGESLTLLQIGAVQTHVLSGSSLESAKLLTLSIGSEATAGACFRHEPPTPDEMENAIQIVEDELAPARDQIPRDSILITTDAGIREIAHLAGLPEQSRMVMHRDAVERSFDRLAAVVQGRPAAVEGISASPVFAARLLILREFMHHLQFDSITLKE